MSAKLGTAHHLSKLDPDKVREARREYAKGGITMLELGFNYGVSLSTIQSAIRRLTWTHVKEEGEDDGT